jgi:hypothetical protein
MLIGAALYLLALAVIAVTRRAPIVSGAAPAIHP